MLNYKNYGRLWLVYGRSIFRYFSLRKTLNALKTEFAYRRRHTDVKSLPYLLSIEPLYYCNLVCPLCDRQGFHDARREDAGRLPLEVLDKILDELGAYLWQCQIFGLGEPLLDWPRTKAIVQRARERRVFTLVSTNCTLVTPEMADDIVTSGLDHLVCAIDGISQESYGKYRVGGRVDVALANLKMLADAKAKHHSKIEIEWQFLVNKYNESEIEAARGIAEDIGVFIRFAPMRGMEWDEKLQERWLPQAAQWQDGRVAPGEAISPYPCYYLWRSLTINSNGAISRCPIFQNVGQYGNLLQAPTVMSLYNGPSSQRARELFKKGEVATGEFPNPCNNCAFFHREHGGENLGKQWTLGKPPKPVKSFVALEALNNGLQSTPDDSKREADLVSADAP